MCPNGIKTADEIRKALFDQSAIIGAIDEAWKVPDGPYRPDLVLLGTIKPIFRESAFNAIAS